MNLKLLNIIFCLFANVKSRLFNGQFQAYWNIPSFMCNRHGITFNNITKDYGIVQNDNDEFRGNHVIILYDPGYFPAILQDNKNKNFLRNGGVPQAGNISQHLKMFKEHLDQLIPNEEYNGIAVIDFESWRPIYRQNFGSLVNYKTVSIQIERKNHPFWTDKQLEMEATKRFETTGKEFMLKTIELAKKLRSKAKWGYYAFPYCFNNNGEDKCTDNVMNENNKIKWLWQSSDLILPSVYLTDRVGYKIVRGRINEAVRVSQKVSSPIKPNVLTYIRYVYTDNPSKYLTETDLFESLRAIKEEGSKGVILWGSSNDLNTKEKCIEFKNYLENTLGPVVQSFQKRYTVHSRSYSEIFN